MTINEFKAWLEGFDAAISDSPTPTQWKLIKDKLLLVDAKAYRSLTSDVVPITLYPTTTCSNIERNIRNEY